MTERPAQRPDDTGRIGDGAFRVVVLMAAVLVALTGIRLLTDAPNAIPSSTGSASDLAAPGSASPASPVDIADLLLEPVAAPPLSFDGPGGTVSLAGLRGELVLVFFGYTHCPDVCPATFGTVGLAIDAYGPGARALFVSVDPERDTPEWLAEFARFLPAGFEAVTGSPSDVRRTTGAWGVRYAKVDTGDGEAYAMSHTADVFVVDVDGTLRARLPFGTDAPTMTAVLRTVASTRVAGVPPTPAPTASAAGVATDLTPLLVSSSVWAGGAAPVIFTLGDDVVFGSVEVRLETSGGEPAGPSAAAQAVRPTGIARTSYVADLDIPTTGTWRVAVSALDMEGAEHRGSFDLTALDPGGTAALGRPAPTASTLTPDDVGGDLTWLTTDPLPDPRLSATSTAAALAAREPFVLVVDSVAFRVTPQCGQAVVMARRLVDRWSAVPFIHHEPYRYQVVTREPVLDGSLDDPRLTEVAEAWGVGSQPWGAASMPWIFVVDGAGIVRAKYQGVIGTADIDVLLTMLTQGPMT